MNIDLDRKDIIALLRGVTPHPSVMNKIPKELGEYVGGFHNEWQWNYIEEDIPYSDEFLFDMYLMCKNSWGD